MATTTSNASSFTKALQGLLRSKDMVMALCLVMIIALMLIPLPPVMIDLLIAVSIALSIGIILMTMYISQPMEFSVFPTVLLLVTLLRLGINISISRSILLNGEAGQIIETFGNLIVGGNYVVGVVIFLIIMIIQFIVINSGAGRVAEVAARFTLDAMPGKQMAIDADLNSGLIDEHEARRRRKAIETEADFYGAMDGSSKFVRGDAIAAIIIMLVNIIGGFVIGVLQRGMELDIAIQTYVLVTIGAGLAIQIPALLVSAAAGLIVTRSTSESSLGTELFEQLSNFNVLAIGAILVGVMMLVPGLPKLPFALVAIGLGAAAFFVDRIRREEAAALEVPPPVQTMPTEPETPEQMLQMVVVDPIELEIGYSLIPMIEDNSHDNLLRRITGIRRQLMAELGLILPVVRIRDNLHLPPQAYRIKVRGQEVANGEILLDRLLAIPNSDNEPIQGIPTTEPAFGLPALWITEADQNHAEITGYTVVAPLSVISTHLTEVVRTHAPNLLTRQMVQEMLNQLKQKSPASVDGVVPEMIGLGDVQSVLRNLLRERIPIRDLTGILEVLANHAQVSRDGNILAEAVRQTMANTISSQYRDENNTLHVFTLAPQLESILRSSMVMSENGPGFQIDAVLAQQMIVAIGDQMENLARTGHMPILLCPRELRLAVYKLVSQSLPNLIVLAFSEVSSGTKVKAYGTANAG